MISPSHTHNHLPPHITTRHPPTRSLSQAYFSYDAHKSGGVTVSHLRFGPEPIHAPYLVGAAHYLGVHQETYFAK